MTPAFYVLGMAVYRLYYYAFERRGEQAIQGLAFFFGLLFVGEVSLVLIFGVDYRFVEARYIGPSLHLGFVDLPLRMLVPCVFSLIMVAVLQLYLTRSFIGRAILAVSQDPGALQLMAASPTGIKQIAFGISIATCAVAGSFLIIIQPVEPSIGRDYIGRIFAICVLGGMTSFPGMLVAAHAARHRREHHRDVLRPLLGAGRRVRLAADNAGGAPGRSAGALAMRNSVFWAILVLVGVVFVVLSRTADRQRVFLFAGLRRAAVHRAVDRVEHPRRLYRLHQFRHRRVFRGRRLQLGRAAQIAGAAAGDLPVEDPASAAAGDDRGRRRRLRRWSVSAPAI